MNSTETGTKATKHAEEIHLQIRILVAICVLIYIVTAIWVLLRSYYITTLNLDLSAILDPSFSAPTATEEERRLNLLERVAPTKPFITWWKSVQTERSPLKDYDRVFDWYAAFLSLHLPLNELIWTHTVSAQFASSLFLKRAQSTFFPANMSSTAGVWRHGS
ncbi:hypothetical protein ANOM_001947 [Aspergillus nomiae NRRL 13137]|uniref:Uncharacterized protein n=1 Tax=Aspergillus nomiae NRRL (strain ATCC 15546 / NRRL 13137 / CBS 260.88 / M93) TaxID=1509407 RepID=A0A0L1JD64_ASPN3|nr:uncharacterized protein ANOM_001947 [Aspergillus nomiae NRRL 13137]KNG89724.1 hypothetical protein ANOM_001947 [Aspergillus nomiae NRRL 13137]